MLFGITSCWGWWPAFWLLSETSMCFFCFFICCMDSAGENMAGASEECLSLRRLAPNILGGF